MAKHTQIILNAIRPGNKICVHVFSKTEYDRESIDEALSFVSSKLVALLENDRNFYIVRKLRPETVKHDIVRIKTSKGSLFGIAVDSTWLDYLKSLLDYLSDTSVTYEYIRQSGDQYIIRRTVNDFI